MAGTEAFWLLNGTANSPTRTTVVEAAEATFFDGGLDPLVFRVRYAGKRLIRSLSFAKSFGTFFLGRRYWPNHPHGMKGGPSGLRPRMDRLSLVARPADCGRGDMDLVGITGIRLVFVGAWSAIALSLVLIAARMPL
jgi:hypothetical protein